GRLTDGDVFALTFFQYRQPLTATPEPDRTEVDITTQTLTLYENYQPKLITTMSSGSGENYCYDTPRENPTQHVCEDANTPSGDYAFYEFRPGWDKSPLGELYNPYYFNKGIAVHGYYSVPTTPASHGCVRIPMHIAEYFHDLVHRGDPVHVFGGKPAKVTSSTPLAPVPHPGGPGPAGPPPGAAPRAAEVAAPPGVPPRRSGRRVRSGRWMRLLRRSSPANRTNSPRIEACR